MHQNPQSRGCYVLGGIFCPVLTVIPPDNCQSENWVVVRTEILLICSYPGMVSCSYPVTPPPDDDNDDDDDLIQLDT